MFAIGFGWYLFGLLFLASCHDAPRKNPFDPELTPPVELSVALDDTAGTATLSWTPYAGDQPFGAYWVLRKVQGMEAVDTLAVVSEVSQTSYVDSTLTQHTTYVYRISVTNVSGFEVISEDRVVLPMQLPGVQIITADFNSATASATLEWTPYAGPDFRAYQVRRRTAEEASRIVFESQDLAVTSCLDSNLVGATEYLYQVVVVTKRGEEIPGEEVKGSVHTVVDIWPIEIEPEQGDNLRLYFDPDGWIVALATGQNRDIRSLYFDPGTGWVEERVSLDFERDFAYGFHPKQAARTVDAEGQVFFSVGQEEGGRNKGICKIYPLELGDSLKVQTTELFADAFPRPLDGAEAIVRGEIKLESDDGLYDNVELFVEGQLVFAEDFEFELEWVPSSEGRQTTVRDWLLSGGYSAIGGWLFLNGEATRTDSGWHDFRLEIDANITSWGTAVSIQIGEETYSRFALSLDAVEQQARLAWVFNPPSELGLEPQEQNFEAPFMVLWATGYRLALEVVDGQVRATVQHPVVWFEELRWTGTEGQIYNSSLAALGNTLALTLEDHPYAVSQDGVFTELPRLES